ncbi:hypothetical protein BC826DRAFT_1102794 [Russula brevipes]|nr:hypothetical protein BC826DRAFT_1102794 [Russula brevipes]
MSSRPTPLPPEASLSTSPSSCDTTKYVRTPDDLAPSKRVLNPLMGWTRADVVQHSRDHGGAAIALDATMPSNRPLACTIWSGSCNAGQLSSGGLLDSSRHGQVHFLNAEDPTGIWVRTSTEARTMQVAGAILATMTQPASEC